MTARNPSAEVSATTPAPQSANAVWKLGETTTMGIYGTESSACYTWTLGQACPLCPAAAKTFRNYLGHVRRSGRAQSQPAE